MAITGHRDGFFRPLKDIQPGDVIEVQREDATDHYIVRGMKIVAPSDTSVLNPTAGNTLTLVTCYPFYFIGSAAAAVHRAGDTDACRSRWPRVCSNR